MMGRKIYSSVLVLLVATLAYGLQTDTQWVKVAPADGQFGVLMPIEPGRNLKTSESVNKTSTVHHYQTRTKNAVYWVIWLNYSPDTKLNVEETLNFSRDAVNKGMNAKLLTETKITLNGNHGLEYKAENDNNLIECKVYLVGNNLYHLTAVTPKITNDADNRDKFFSSFELAASK